MKTVHALLLILPLASPAAQEPSLEKRLALSERFERADRLVRGGRVRARWLDDGSSFWFRAGGRSVFVDPGEGRPRAATRADRRREPDRNQPLRGARLHSPDGRFHLETRSGSLVLRGSELERDILLTGLSEDLDPFVFWALDPGGWSGDGAAVYATRVDLSAVHHLPVVDYRRAIETLEEVPYIKAGSPWQRQSLAIFHMSGHRRVDVDPGTQEEHYLFPLGWREGADELLWLRLGRDAQRLDLMATDSESGESRVVLSESSQTFVGGLDFITGGWRDCFTPLEGGMGFLWISERDGWRHLYRYDYEGQLLARLTAGEFPVQAVVGVDPERGRVFLTANAGERPYDTHLYRVDLEGGELRCLTAGSGEHEVQLSPSRLYFVDTHSSPARSPVCELRDAEGELISELDRADTSELEALDWSPPESFRALAADGETPLHGALYLPTHFDPGRSYPVIDLIYSGPFRTIVPNRYGFESPFARRAQALAELGFAVFLVDPRGTTERGKVFQDATWGRIGELEIPDHVAVLRQLAEERPWLDLDRVGVYGHSWGGYFALRAMLTAPEDFHVGVASAPGELTESAPINEPYMGLPETNPEGYAAGLNAPLAGGLAGPLLIVHGTADVNAPFSTSMRMVAALIEADRDFELLVLPGATHQLSGVPGRYATRRVREFFLEHLRGE